MTELTRLTPGQTLPARYRPAVMDHYGALARDADPTHVQQLSNEIASRKQTCPKSIALDSRKAPSMNSPNVELEKIGVLSTRV
jgi:hypothetical protein